MAASWKNLLQITKWVPDRWEAPERDFIGHRDIITRNLSRYHFVVPHVHGALLDIGCGRGYGFEILAPRSTSQVGVDISRLFLGEAREQFREISFACASGDALPLAASSFDALLAFEVIEHVEDDSYFLKELKRVARRDAFIALSTPNRLISSGKSVKPLDPFHVREYEAAEFYRLLKPIFSSVELFGQHERVRDQFSRNRLLDRVPIRWKYLFPHYIQTLLSVALRPPLRLVDCRFHNENLEQAHTFVALCRR